MATFAVDTAFPKLYSFDISMLLVCRSCLNCLHIAFSDILEKTVNSEIDL
jgi:hypothetical protein